MKQTKAGAVANQSCSCTSCLYKSESDRPSLRRLIAQGSKIDKLYYGKYIPLRERKLLNKLVRTRAVYDDIRNQLLSSSNISVAQANLKPKKKAATAKPDKRAQKGGDIPTLVDLVDKGDVPLAENFSECCNCCICDSKQNVHEESPQPHVHKHKRRAGARMASKSSVISKRRAEEKTTVGKAVHFKTKHIRSDPCTCTYKLGRMIKRHSKSVLKKLRRDRPEPVLEYFIGAPEQNKPKKKKIVNKAMDKVKQSKTRLVKGMQEGANKSATKIKETKARLKENIETAAKKSLEIIQDTKHRVQEKIESRRPRQEELEIQIPEELIEDQIFKIRKDSLTKFREKLRRKRELQDWECDYDCLMQECTPEECFKIITRRRLRKANNKGVPDSTSAEKQEKKLGETMKMSDISIQSSKTKKLVDSKKNKETKMVTEKKKKIDSSCLCIQIKRKAVKDTKARGTRPERKSSETKSVGSLPEKPSKSPVRVLPTEHVAKIDAKKKESVSGINVRRPQVPKRLEENQKEPQIPQRPGGVRVGSTISFNIEFYKEVAPIGTSQLKSPKEISSLIKERQHKVKTKEKHSHVKIKRKRNEGYETSVMLSGKNIQAGANPLKRCFCTLKLKPRRTKPKVNVDKVFVKKESVTESVQTKEIQEPMHSLEPYECEPGVCIPDECDPIECEKRIKKRNRKQLHSLEPYKCEPGVCIPDECDRIECEKRIKKRNRKQHYSLEPYECEPGVCVPGECDPIECEKRIKKRNRKQHTVSINTEKQMKSSSSITTKSESRSASRGLQVQLAHKPQNRPRKESAGTFSVAPAVKTMPIQRPTRQARQTVRIGSTFSFQIEFSKGDANIAASVLDNRILNKKPSLRTQQIKVEKHRKQKGVPAAKKYIKRKYSQASSSTRNKFTSQKHKLKRCFCTLKINKLEKKRPRFISTSTFGQMTNIPEPKPAVRTVSIATKKIYPKIKPQLLPYECEPGVCIPGECDPYACLELIKRREFQTKTTTSNTDYRKTKSTSSFSPKIIKHSRTKQVQSTLVAHKGKIPSSSMNRKMPTSGMVLLPSQRPLKRQAVRIGSTFSFNIEFYKDNPSKEGPVVYYRSSPKVSQPKAIVVKQEKKQITRRARGSQGSFVPQSKSVHMQAERKQKSVTISTAMKRCFCTLKLRKPVKSAMKDVITVGTKTPKFKIKEPKYQTIAINKRMKEYQNNLQQLEPYECEPYVCTPGECDPYECLERIKNRNKKLYSREIGVIVKPSKMISTSSSIQNIGKPIIKHTFAQSRTTAQKRKKIKDKHTTAEQIPRIPKVYAEKQSRQSVKLGSSFSFDIEFHKDRKSDEHQIEQIPREHGDVQDSKSYKNRGGQSLRTTMTQNKSQAHLIKKSHRGTGVVPILKRCFCTLQLQKRKHHPKNTQQVYTVSRVGVTKPAFLQNHLVSNNFPAAPFTKNKDNYYLGKNCTTNAVASYSSRVLTSNIFSYSTMSIDSKIVQPYLYKNRYQNNYTNSITGPIFSQPIFRVNSNLMKNTFMKTPKAVRSLCTKNPSSTRHFKKSSEINIMKFYDSYASASKRLTNEMSSYLSRQYCAMNIQVPNKYRSPNKYKLEPYECEPGFCVPYECDPLVCKERIMKRLMRNASKSSGTDSRYHSASSITSNAPYRSKRLQSNATSSPTRKVRTQSPSIVSHEKEYFGSQRQAVRVGSNFSFNIEFSKDNMQPSNAVKEISHKPSTTRRRKRPADRKRHRGTRGYLRRGTDQESQSLVKMAHRGSSATPLLKRCFCTLKLQKKGKHEKGISSTEDKGVAFNNDIVTIQTVDSTQNTERQKHRKLRHALLPYECEPGVCIPGECNPYECLELIKKRNRDFGTDSMKFGRMSSSSMTPSQKRRMKNRRNQLNLKEKKHRVPKRKHSVQSCDVAKPSRQAVRIGSTFSFNVEFFKDNPNLIPTTSVTSRNLKSKPHREKIIPRRTRDTKERFSQDDKSMRDKDSQSGLMQHMKSTMTGSLFKRCFCTANLHKREKRVSPNQNIENKTVNVNIEQQTKRTPFLQRCICIIKSLTATKVKSGTLSQTKHESVPKPPRPQPLQGLLPYECTPGVCVPGECDPYVCEQLIRKRNAKLGTKITNTERLRTKSQSSSFQSYGSSRAKQTQRSVDTSSKVVKPSSSGDFDKRDQVECGSSPGRQAVRIGSSFNFNIEFYKDNPTVDTIVEHLPRKRRESDTSKMFKPRTKSRGSLERRKRKYDRDSQAQGTRTQDKASGVGQMLQRCFCTLNLRKPKVPKQYADSGTQSRRTPVVIEPDTKSVMSSINKRIPYKLEPYECEPYTCIPGQCDPYECEKRIQRRLRREHGTSTVYSKTKSAASMASSSRKLKNTMVQSRSKKTRRRRTDMDRTRTPKYYEPDRPSRQAVRIGSTFSFDIEFFKDNGIESKSKCVTESNKQYKDVGDYDHKRKKRCSASCPAKSCQAQKRMREVDSQVLAKKMRSTMTGVSPFLQRCFCTLKLQKPKARAREKETHIESRPKMVSDNKSTYTSKKLYKPPPPMRFKHLEPYECEPGVCVPGQCDPYECEKRIKMRNIGRHSVSSNTERCPDYSKCVSATTRHRGRKSQAMTIPRERKKQKSTMTRKPCSYIRESDLKPSSSPHRQAVRIGSNFSFDIEFFKDKSLNGATRQVVRSDKVEKSKDRPRARTLSTGAGNRGISFSRRKSQAYGPTTDTKGSGVGPFLKRCFCTLQLQKQGTQHQRPPVQIQVNYSLEPNSFDACTKTKKQRHVLYPYECEPNVCVPGFCDPYECLRPIKRRQMRELGISTDRPSMISGYSSTSTRTTIDKGLRTKPCIEKSKEKCISFEKVPQPNIVTCESPKRQAVRIGSSFKFDIEFDKEGSTPNDHCHGDGQDCKPSCPKKEPKQKCHKLESRGFQRKCSSRCQGIQMRGVQKQSTGSGMAPFLKRCFCTLALQDTSKQPIYQKPIKPKQQINRTKDTQRYTQSKSTTKTRSLPYALEPYECEPNVCVPGECDPYVCYERIKKRNARYKSRALSKDAGRCSQASMTARHGKCSRRTQSVLFKRRRQHSSSSMNNSMVVEQPRCQLLSDIANRNGVRSGSNISFNIEFYKEIAPPGKVDYTDERRETTPMISPRDKKIMNTDKCNKYCNRESQSESLKPQNKGSLVTNKLKSCFCTAQFPKANVSEPKEDISRKCKECSLKSIFGPHQYQVYYHKASFKKNPPKKCLCVCENDLCKRTKSTSTKTSFRNKLKKREKNKRTNEMETILPYEAKKFNNKTSKTFFKHKRVKNNKENKSKRSLDRLHSEVDQNSVSKNRRLNTKKSAKNINKKLKNPVLTDENLIKSSNVNIKTFLCRCIHFLLKPKKYFMHTTPDCAEICLKANKTLKEPELIKFEKLKKSKSERSPNNENKEAKKSRSLKTNKYLDEIDDDNNYEFQLGNKKRNKKSLAAAYLNKTGILSEVNKKNICPHCGDYNPHLGQKINKDNKKQVKFTDPNARTNLLSSKPIPTSSSKSASKKKKTMDSHDFCPHCQGIDSAGKTIKPKLKVKNHLLDREDNPCARGICKNTGARLTIAAKGDCADKSGIEQTICTIMKNINAVKKTLVTEEQICACYSSLCECAKAIKQEKEQAIKLEIEVENEKRELKEQIKKRKEDERSAKRKRKASVARQSHYERADAARRRKRKKANIYLKRRLRSGKGSDVVLALESVFDLAKLGCNVVGDVTRSTCRFLFDPKYACKKFISSVKDPGGTIKSAVEDIGFVSTLKRVFMRVRAMRGIQAVKNILEENAFTGAIIRAAEEDPLRALPKKKKKKKKKKPRENMDDFECSLYMNSLRKKRFIVVYYLCPWFYPHFVTLLNLFGQVTDIILFLIAVMVWSPCILGVELCRAFVCCFLCTA